MNDANIVIFGTTGAGKSTVGRLVARHLQRTFMDMDARIVLKAGKPVARIFAEDGEEVFRRMERDLVLELAAQKALVIATGGGVVLDPRNVEDLGRTGFLVCLLAQEEEILRRVTRGQHRPLLEGGDKVEKARALLKARRPFYERLPNPINTTRLSPYDTAHQVIRMFQKQGQPAVAVPSSPCGQVAAAEGPAPTPRPD